MYERPVLKQTCFLCLSVCASTLTCIMCAILGHMLLSNSFNGSQLGFVGQATASECSFVDGKSSRQLENTVIIQVLAS